MLSLWQIILDSAWVQLTLPSQTDDDDYKSRKLEVVILFFANNFELNFFPFAEMRYAFSLSISSKNWDTFCAKFSGFFSHISNFTTYLYPNKYTMEICNRSENTHHKEKYHCTASLQFNWLDLTKWQNMLLFVYAVTTIQTSQTGDQSCSDTYPYVPWVFYVLEVLQSHLIKVKRVECKQMSSHALPLNSCYDSSDVTVLNAFSIVTSYDQIILLLWLNDFGPNRPKTPLCSNRCT